MKKKEHIYTVSELTRSIRLLLEKNFPSVWVEGEISNLRRPISGHIYLTLKDKNSQLSGVIFRGVNQSLKFELKDGLAVTCFGRIGVYERSGQYQLYIEKLEPRGVGALQLAFQQLKDKLLKEGLFDQQNKKPLPYLPVRIGVVTSPTGAAIRDILSILRRRFANVEVLINPVRVQGEGAAEEIARAIEEFNTFADIDVLIVGRGGGSLEDLWAFNEEVVARAIYKSRIPVISAVGHEIDFCIADFVADLRAPTPSVAAELVIGKKDELAGRIQNCRERLGNAVLSRLTLLKNRLDSISRAYVLRHPLNVVQQYEQRVDELRRDLSLRMEHYLQLQKERFNGSAAKLEALSPLAILSRGYSASFKLPEKKIIKDAAVLKKGDRVWTKVYKGYFVSKLEESGNGDQQP